ncbi:MAG: hypothetical protein GXY85_09820 [Candidatus Brocadiaceae bacterium]|nr:hypothetical protein [Candidatus Brocadiaceae bacterium]
MTSDQDQDLTAPEGIREFLLALLACPACRQPVEQGDGMLRCRGCGRAFPIRDGVPVMLVEEPATAPDGPSGSPPSP